MRAIHRSWQAATLPHPGLWKNSPYLSCWGRRYADGAVVEARPEHDHREIAAITVRPLCPCMRIAGYR